MELSLLSSLFVYSATGTAIALLLAWLKFQMSEKEEELGLWAEATPAQMARPAEMRRAQ